MTRCLDIHTHHVAPQPEGVISVESDNFVLVPGQRYSLGVHPWTTGKSPGLAFWNRFDELARREDVVAIGECGIDKLKGGPLFMQVIVMRHQVDLSERLCKPLIIHDVKAHDVIVGMKRELDITQNWAIHGFRAKPTVAKMMTDAGIYLSFGEKFNPQSLLATPQEMILAETDDSPLSIEEIIAGMSAVAGYDMTDLIAANTERFLKSNRL